MIDARRESYLIRAIALKAVAIAIVFAPHHRASAQTLSVGTNFTSMTYGAATGEPPDTMGAAGPNNFVVTQNDGFAFFSKDGSLLSSMTPNAFWTAALGTNPGGLSDPRVIYDPASQRWFVTMITTDQTTNNQILFARSNTSDPTQGFKGVAFTTTNNRFADFPTLGLDANGVYVGTNNFSSSGTLRSIGLYSVPKADLLAATPTLSRITARNALSANTVGFTLQPAVNYGPKLPTDSEPILANSNTTAGRYNFTPLTGTTAANATLGSTTVKTVLTTSDPTASAQPGSSNTIDNGDARFSSAVVQVGSYLYWTQNITVSGRSAIRWTVASASNFNIVQQGTISDPTLSYFYPSLAVNASGDVVIGFSGSSSSTYASTYAITGTSAGGALGGALTFGSPVLTKAGVTYYDGTRWGDYSATTPDPADPGVFWTQQEFATTRNFTGTNWNWATQATEVIPNKSGERRWSNSVGGNFVDASNYFSSAAPAENDHVIFSRARTSYVVNFSGSNSSDRASVRQGNLTWNLGGGGYSLTNSNVATPSLAVAEFQGTATLNLSAGVLNTTNAVIGAAPGGNGTVNVLAGTNWTNAAALNIGAGGTAALIINDQALVYVGTSLSLGASGTLNVNGGTLRFSSYTPAAGSTLNFTAGTIQLAGDRVTGSDSAIGAFFGALPTIDSNKQLVVEGSATITSAAPLTVNGGTLAALNGATLNPGATISGRGTINTPNSSATPLTNNGAITGNSAAEMLTANGYVSGTGSMDNVHIAGTYAPGPSPASVTLGSVLYSGELNLNIGGTTAGTEFDQLNHTLNLGTVGLGGTLNVSLINGFVPAANDTFEILTAIGGITGTFFTTNLPALPGDLMWNVTYGANTVDLAVEMPVVPLLGDFNGNGVVDIADYVVWQDGLGTTFTQGDFDIWRAHFGDTVASGSSLVKTGRAVPEPASVMLAFWCILATLVSRPLKTIG